MAPLLLADNWPWNQVECWPFAIQRRRCCRSGACCGSCWLFLGWRANATLLWPRFTGPAAAAATTACLWRLCRRLTNCCCLLFSSWGGWPAAASMLLSLLEPKILNLKKKEKKFLYDNLEMLNKANFTGWLYSPPNAPPRRGASKASCSGWPEWGQRLTKLSRNCCSFSHCNKPGNKRNEI